MQKLDRRSPSQGHMHPLVDGPEAPRPKLPDDAIVPDAFWCLVSLVSQCRYDSASSIRRCVFDEHQEIRPICADSRTLGRTRKFALPAVASTRLLADTAVATGFGHLRVENAEWAEGRACQLSWDDLRISLQDDVRLVRSEQALEQRGQVVLREGLQRV